VASQSREQCAELGRGLSFGSVADQYERYRLSDPDELVPWWCSRQDGPPAPRLRVGAGAGMRRHRHRHRRPCLFASQSIGVIALDPTPRWIRRPQQGLVPRGACAVRHAGRAHILGRVRSRRRRAGALRRRSMGRPPPVVGRGCDPRRRPHRHRVARPALHHDDEGRGFPLESGHRLGVPSC
jgi:hypothetical protein